ncbi:MAG: hypothetical protein B7Z09_06090 [Brevundimonas diminuta]|nr:MAG: hypothetical protein B7Z09_06090 [Brevundimonas diminuta]
MLTLSKQQTPAGRRYVLRTFAFMVPYVAICVAMMTTDAFDGVMGRPAGWVLAVEIIGAAAAPLALARMAIGPGRTSGAQCPSHPYGGCITGMRSCAVPRFAGAPHLPAWLIYPLFWAAFGLVSPFIRSSN